MKKNLARSYYNYNECIDYISNLKEKFPQWVDYEIIGKTPENREIWLVSITDRSTGIPEDKPSLWIDANTHASEIAGAQSILYFMDRLLREYAHKNPGRELLKTMNFYFLPMVSPDGAEYFHRTQFEIRSSPQQWPVPAPLTNFEPKDMDGNEEIFSMRQKDEAGAFKRSRQFPEVLVSREPFDFHIEEGPFYNLFHEGEIRNFDGFRQNSQSETSFDFNRQFPNNFRPEGRQLGAGDFPMSSPEIHAFVKTFSSKRRIFGHISLHTYGGVILRPPGKTPEEKLPLKDMMILNTICAEAARVSGYTALSIQKDFKYYSRDNETGDSIEWSFEHRGVYSMTVEIWDLWKTVGIKLDDHVSRYFSPKAAELEKIFSWAKKNLKMSQFFKPWKKFLHPQLGEVEIGGWKTAFLFRNPPLGHLEKEMKKVEKIALQFAKLTPQIHFKSVQKEKVGEWTRLKVVVENKGFLPTHGSQQAISVGAVKKPRIQIQLNSKQKLVSGSREFEVEHLAGRDRFIPISTPVRVFKTNNSHQCQLEWVIQGHGLIGIMADFERGGRIKMEVEI